MSYDAWKDACLHDQTVPLGDGGVRCVHCGKEFDVIPPGAPLPSRDGWRLASSAPKTGEHILVTTKLGGHGFGRCGGKLQDRCAVVHYWDNPGEEGFYLSNGASDPFDDRPWTFSHWMPLPHSEIANVE